MMMTTTTMMMMMMTMMMIMMMSRLHVLECSYFNRSAQGRRRRHRILRLFMVYRFTVTTHNVVLTFVLSSINISYDQWVFQQFIMWVDIFTPNDFSSLWVEKMIRKHVHSLTAWQRCNREVRSFGVSMRAIMVVTVKPQCNKPAA
jgi:hypothetical protein